MIVVDKNTEIKELLTKNALESGAIFLDEMSLEVSTLNRNELYIVDEDVLIKTEAAQKLTNCAAIVVFAPQKKIESFLELLNIVAVIDHKSSSLLLKNQIKILNNFCTEKEFLRSQMVSL